MMIGVLTVSSPTAFWGSVVNLHPDHKKFTIELLDVALNLANIVEMRVKHAMACRRPIEYSPQVQPMILTPGHGSLPSGHATEAHMIARLLLELLGAATTAGNPSQLLREQLMRQAARVAINRTVAGVHFPVDSMAGEMLGLKLADYLIARCRGTGGPTVYTPRLFNGEMVYGTSDFDFREQYNTTSGALNIPPSGYIVEQPALNHKIPSSGLLSWLWDKAKAEWS